jgi:hypothetical protein
VALIAVELETESWFRYYPEPEFRFRL